MITWNTGDTLRAVDLNANFAEALSVSSSRTVSATHQWNATQAFNSGLTAGAAVTITASVAASLTVGRQGATDPVLRVDASAANVVTGLLIAGAAAAGGVAVSVISSGTNENLTVDAKGSGTITLNATGTGGITAARLLTASLGITVTNGQTLTVTGVTVTGLTAASVGTGTFPGVYTITGALTLSSTLTGGSTSDITINTNKFTVVASSGNTTVAGTLGVTGVTTLTGGAKIPTTVSLGFNAAVTTKIVEGAADRLDFHAATTRRFSIDGATNVVYVVSGNNFQLGFAASSSVATASTHKIRISDVNGDTFYALCTNIA